MLKGKRRPLRMVVRMMVARLLPLELAEHVVEQHWLWED